MSDERESKQGHLGSLIAGAGVVFLIVYLLSPGLLSYFFKHGGPTETQAKVIGVLYAPIRFIYERVDFVKAFYDWYFGLFP